MGVFAYFVSRAVLSSLFEDWPERMQLAVVIGKDADGSLSAENHLVLFHESQAGTVLGRIAGDNSCDPSDVLVAPENPELPQGAVFSTWSPGAGDEAWILGQVRGRKGLEEEAADLGLTIEFAQSEGIDPSVLMAKPEERVESEPRPSWKSALMDIAPLSPEVSLEAEKPSPRQRIDPPVLAAVRIPEKPPAFVPPAMEAESEEPEVLGYFSPSAENLSSCSLSLAVLRRDGEDVILEAADAGGQFVPERRAPLATLIGEDLCSFLMPPGLGTSWTPANGLHLRIPSGMLPAGYAAEITSGSMVRIASTPWAVHLRVIENPAPKEALPQVPTKNQAKRKLVQSAAIGAGLGLALVGAAAGIAWARPGETQAFLERLSDVFGVSHDWVGRLMANILS